VFFTWKCIKIIFFFIFKKLFLISAHQNDLKTPKIYQFKAKKKNKKINFFQKRFWIAKTNKVLRNSVKKTCKNRFTKTVFKTQFFSGPRSTKHNLICYQITCCVCFTANAKAGENKRRCVWYCGNFYGCGLKNIVFIKNTFSWGWFGKIYVWLKLWLKLRLNKK
jgi:hypothetical protein